MVAYFLLDENWHFFAFLCSTDTPSIKYHGRLLGPGPLFGTREYVITSTATDDAQCTVFPHF